MSFSGGKDSTAMLLMMLERNMKIDCILFCDTGLEFPDMYKHIAKLESDIGRPITRVKSEHSYEYLMLDKKVNHRENSTVIKKYGSEILGYGWPGPRQRWCTTQLKDIPRGKFMQKLYKQYDVKEYIGIAADEQYRLKRKRNKNLNHIHPLVEWNMKEDDCLQYCFEHGYNWNGLYRNFSRVSCWCCPLQSLDELRSLYRNYPELWEQMKIWDKKSWRQFRADYSVEELEKRFNFEDEWQKSGKTMRDKAFFHALKRELMRSNYSN